MPLHHTEKAALSFMARHLAIGIGAGAAFGALLLAQDWGGLHTLISTADTSWLWYLMLFFGLFITFGGVGLAIGVMSLGEHDN